MPFVVNNDDTIKENYLNTNVLWYNFYIINNRNWMKRKYRFPDHTDHRGEFSQFTTSTQFKMIFFRFSCEWRNKCWQMTTSIYSQDIRQDDKCVQVMQFSDTLSVCVTIQIRKKATKKGDNRCPEKNIFKRSSENQK